MKRSRVSRMLQILTALQSGQNNRIDDLAQMCTLSKRTIFRDLKELKEIGIPCRYDTKSGSYSTDPDFFLTPLNLNRREAIGLLLLVLAARNRIQIPFKKETLIGALKVENNLPAEIRQYCNALLRNISIKAGPEAEMGSLDNIFQQLGDAILKKQVVRISYYSSDEKKTIAIELNPYHLLYDDYTWYVLGESSFHRRIQAFKLNRIKELSNLDKVFVEDETFDVSEYLGRAWSLIPEGRLYHVKLRFLPEAAHNVAEVKWHHTQRVTFEEDGSAIVQFRVDGLNEITWWILGYGDKVQVLAPPVLRQKIVQIAQEMVKTNQ
ncbi:MAG: WYL domain-containing transcriptional regulator [Sedimentisphaerales bacterium]|nr:WYL domain-containing transcriptional regulator [Sedimentisphaerales bacterium]